MNPILSFTVALAIALAACGDDRKKMAADIEAWGVHWQRERECLLSADPPAKDAREAFIVRAIVAGSAAALVNECLQDKTLLRSGDARVDDQSVEATWQDLNKAVESLHRARLELTGGNEEVAPSMARRIAAVDSIYERLRSRAGLSPIVLPGTPLPEQPHGVVVGRIGKGASIATPQLVGNTLVIWQTTDAGSSIVAVGGPNNIERYPASGAHPAVSEDPWGVVVVPGPKWFEVRLTDGTVIAKEPTRSVERIEPRFAAGGANGRAVIYELRGPEQLEQGKPTWPPPVLKVVASTDGTWKTVLTATGTPPSDYELDPYVYTDWARGRADIVWGDLERNLYWASLRDGALTAPARKSAGKVSHFFNLDPVGCFGETHGWWLSDKQLWFAAGDDSPVVAVPNYVHGEATLRCNDDYLVRVWPTDGGHQFQRCTREGCTRPRPAEAVGSLGLARDGTMITAFVTQGVLFAQPEGKRPRPLFRLGLHSKLYGIMHAPEGWQALVTDPEGARLVPLGL